MTKKQYFYALWAISSIGVVATSAWVFLNIPHTEQEIPLKFFTIASALLGVVINGFFITMGLYFSQKIGAKLLFLDGHFDWKKDIIKPAALGAIIYAVVALVVNLLLMKLSGNVSDFSDSEGLPLLVERQETLLHLFSNISVIGLFSTLFAIGSRIFELFNADIVSLLLVLSGVALLVKKVFRDMSTSKAMLISIFILAVFATCNGIRVHGFSMLAVVSIVEAIRQVFLGLLFRKKGFEAAVLCHIMIVSILCAVSPLVVFALRA